MSSSRASRPPVKLAAFAPVTPAGVARSGAPALAGLARPARRSPLKGGPPARGVKRAYEGVRVSAGELPHPPHSPELHHHGHELEHHPQIVVEEAALDEHLSLGTGEHEDFRIEMPQMELRGDPMVADQVGLLKLEQPHHGHHAHHAVIQEETIGGSLGRAASTSPELTIELDAGEPLLKAELGGHTAGGVRLVDDHHHHHHHHHLSHPGDHLMVDEGMSDHVISIVTQDHGELDHGEEDGLVHGYGDTQEINLSDISYVTLDDNGDTVIIVNTDQVLPEGLDPSHSGGGVGSQSGALEGYTLSSDHLLGGHHIISSSPGSPYRGGSLVLSSAPTGGSSPAAHLVSEGGGQHKPEYGQLGPGEKIFICVLPDCPYYCLWQGDMIVHLISAHSAQLPVDKIVPVALDTVEHGEGKCSYCPTVCFVVTTIAYFDSSVRKLHKVKKTYRQCKLCGYTSTGSIFNHIPQCHQGGPLLSEAPTLQLHPAYTSQPPIMATSALLTSPALSSHHSPTTHTTFSGGGGGTFTPSHHAHGQPRIMEVTTVNNRPTYKLPFIDLVSSVKSGRLETPSERNKRKKRKPGVGLGPHLNQTSPPALSMSPARILGLGGPSDGSPQSATTPARYELATGPSPAAGADSESLLKKPPSLHITRQTVANFVCRTCGKVQKDNQTLMQHIAMDHKHDKRFKCSKCPFQTDSVMEWNNHYLDCTIQPDYKIEKRMQGENGEEYSE